LVSLICITVNIRPDRQYVRAAMAAAQQHSAVCRCHYCCH